jgi:hypothetical protein
MSVEKLLQMGGVQMMLGNLLKAAAPQLGEQVNEIAKVILEFKNQASRIEANQLLIMSHLGIQQPAQPAKNGADNGAGTAKSAENSGSAA